MSAMTLAIDASVFVSAARTREAQCRVNMEFLEQVAKAGNSVSCSSLVLPECAGAITRAAGQASSAEFLVARIRPFPHLQLASITPEIGQDAARIASTCRIKGSDACYFAVAQDRQATRGDLGPGGPAAHRRKRGHSRPDRLAPPSRRVAWRRTGPALRWPSA